MVNYRGSICSETRGSVCLKSPDISFPNYCNNVYNFLRLAHGEEFTDNSTDTILSDENYFYNYQHSLTQENKIKSEMVSIYPNPSLGKITVQAVEGFNISSIRIYNMMGAVVINRNLNSSAGSETKIDFHDSPKGLYVVLAEIDGAIVIKKIILN